MREAALSTFSPEQEIKELVAKLQLDAASSTALGLAQLATRLEKEITDQRRRLRKQELDSSTLFEIISQTNARTLDVNNMQTYLLRTVSGHFTTPKLLISRRMKAEDRNMVVSACQGIKNVDLTISLDSVLAVEALKRRSAFFIADLTDEAKASPEIAALRGLNIEVVVPLIQEVETPEVILEGCLFLGARLAKRPYVDSDINFLDVLGKMLAICLRNEALYRRSIVDDLTGVASRGHFEAHLAQQINRVQIYGHRSLGLVLLDVDHFKKFNDTYGHQTGDRVLQELARTLMAQVRNVDLVARYGGEEFAVILLEIDRQRVLEVAERLRKAIATMDVVAMDGTKLKVTASLGAACFPNDVSSKTELIQKADQALYRAKDGGRNQVVMTEPPAPSLEILAANAGQPEKPSDSHALRRRAGEGESELGINT